MNDSGTSRVSGLEKRLGGLGLNLVRPVMCRDIEPLEWLLCAKAFSLLEREKGDYHFLTSIAGVCYFIVSIKLYFS